MTSVASTLTNQGIPEATVKVWSALLTQVRADETLRQRLVDSPSTVLHEHGIEIPAGMEIRVVENTDKVSYLTLPAKGAQELTADELTQVSGGNPVLAGAALVVATAALTYSIMSDALKTGTLKEIKKPTKPK